MMTSKIRFVGSVLATILALFGGQTTTAGQETSPEEPTSTLQERIRRTPTGGAIAPIEAPFDMPQLKRPVFADRTFSIADFGAVRGGQVKNTAAFAKAIEACHKAGGGKVVVPAGTWLTGPIHLRSNVHLYLSEGSEIFFSDRFEDYLPVVFTRWEGVECYNYSPFIYARDCENIAMVGRAPSTGHADSHGAKPPDEQRKGSHALLLLLDKVAQELDAVADVLIGTVALDRDNAVEVGFLQVRETAADVLGIDAAAIDGGLGLRSASVGD